MQTSITPDTAHWKAWATDPLIAVSLLPIVQVLDDSTCKATRRLVEDKVAEWRERGVNVQCICRDNRQGYKAGALKEVRQRQLHGAAHSEGMKLSISRGNRQGIQGRRAEAGAAVQCADVISDRCRRCPPAANSAMAESWRAWKVRLCVDCTVPLRDAPTCHQGEFCWCISAH